MAAHELLGQDGALDIAVVMAADAQDGVLAVGVDLGRHIGRHAGGGQLAQLGFQNRGALLGLLDGVELDLHAIGNGA